MSSSLSLISGNAPTCTVTIWILRSVTNIGLLSHPQLELRAGLEAADCRPGLRIERLSGRDLAARYRRRGIADVLLSDYAPTGQLSFTWPGSADQHLINVGDEEYDPLFPFGYGLGWELELEPDGRGVGVSA